MNSTVRQIASLSVLVLASVGCGFRGMVDVMMRDAHRPPPPPSFYGGAILAGDLHLHVRPPDGDGDVTRGVEETIRLAEEEGLDFVMLTPHVRARFFERDDERAWVIASQRELAESLASHARGRTLFVRGVEYTDHDFGHIGVGFVDLERVLAGVSADEARARPAAFFEHVVADGGLLVLNHPLNTPLDSMFSIARADLSFRPLTRAGESVPEEIDFVARHAQAIEAFNLSATHLRDRLLLDDEMFSLNRVLRVVDHEGEGHGRWLAPVGGSDSHGHYERATTFVLASERTERGVRDAIVAGRVCVRSPEACTFEARIPDGEWVGIGGSIRGARALELRAEGGEVVVFVDGRAVTSGRSNDVLHVDVPPRCTSVRAKVTDGFSAPIRVNCR